MRKIVLSLHVTLDGYLGGPNGEMNWIKLDHELFDLVGTFTNEADTALYGRVTFEMMEGYWPTAGQKPNASKHDVEHSAWYNKVNKIVVSNSMKDKVKDKTTFVSENVIEEIEKLKNQEGKNIIIFGSPSVARLLIQHNLVDDYWLFVNPVILGQGIPMFPKMNEIIKLKLDTTKVFKCGVAALHYTTAK
jgi:dihydrofolate reductase